jgi:DNA-binding response OmpR family regulator
MSFFSFFKRSPAPPPEPSPLRKSSEDERRLKPRKTVRPGTQVLIIDDSKTVVAVLQKLLRENNFTTLEAYDAESALEMLKTHSPELIFLDIVLPGMNGFEALRHIRRMPAHKDVPIIMISGNESATEQFYVQRIGANDFMKKPFSRAEVFVRVERLLNLVPTVLRAPSRSA